MKRRDFLKTSVVAGAAFGMSINGIEASLPAIHAAPDLVAVMGGDPASMLLAAIKEMGGISSFVKKGQKIVIKPNIGWDRAPERAANTNPELIKALITLCLSAGAAKVSVFDNTCDDWQKCYKSSGIEEAVKASGGVMLPGNNDSYYKEVTLPAGVKLKSVKIHEALLEADAWINVPILKHHGGAKMSCAMKNYMGIVLDRRFFHSSDLQQCIADLCSWDKKPVLNIIDAYRIMVKNGPQGRSVADVQTPKQLLASRNIVALDAAALAVFNQFAPQKLEMAAVGHIGHGQSLKLGSTDLSKLNIQRIKLNEGASALD
ncbi:MAG: DUF362 domain-containing protein [Tannerellaceae bacterium]|jgi:uncharacterized protein (DUF362 family)|nr:DUF362 domain-containing protein [Tannerellaceae bacterium]